MVDRLVEDSVGRLDTEPDAWTRIADSAGSEYRQLAASIANLSSRVDELTIALKASNVDRRGHGRTLTLDPPGSSSPALSAVPGQGDFDVRVRMLGPFRLDVGDSSVGPGLQSQVRTVLEYLISQGRRPTPRDAIVDLLWPDANPRTAFSRLRVVIHTLRRALPSDQLQCGDLILSSGNNFLLNPEATLWVDVNEFEERWKMGWRLARAGKMQEAVYHYEIAEALYVGDFLEDEPYADWTLLKREALRDAYASILTLLANMSLAGGDYTGAIIWSLKLLAQDDCREDAYRILITSHRNLGQRGRAAHWYRHCVDTLQRELGLEPAPETVAVHNAG